MSEYDSLIEGYPGLDDPANDPGPLTDEEHQALEEMTGTPLIDVLAHEDADEVHLGDGDRQQDDAELRVLRGDQRPQAGRHYVVFGGKPCPVRRDTVSFTEDEYVRSNLDPSDTLKDHDGQRQARAERTLRMRYRGYVCGEMNTL